MRLSLLSEHWERPKEELHKCRFCPRMMAGAQAVCKFCQSNLRKKNLCIECGKNQPRRLLSPKSGSDFCPQCQEDHMSAGGAMVLKHADTYHPRDKRSDYIKPEDRAPEAREDLYITRHNKGSGKD